MSSKGKRQAHRSHWWGGWRRVVAAIGAVAVGGKGGAIGALLVPVRVTGVAAG